MHATGVVFALGVALVLACNDGNEEDDNQFREDVIWCEEAVARLERCCPGFEAIRVECTFYYSRKEGCGTTDTRRVKPAFTTDESRCIHDASCATLVDTGVCERASENGAARTELESIDTTSSSTSSGASGTSSTSGSPPRPRVCP